MLPLPRDSEPMTGRDFSVNTLVSSSALHNLLCAIFPVYARFGVPHSCRLGNGNGAQAAVWTLV